MNNLPIPQSRSEELMNAFIQRDSSQISTPQSRIEEFWYHLIEGTNSLPIPQSRNELLLKKIIENDTHQIPLAQSRTEEFLVSILTGDINKLPIPQSRSEYYLDYIARNNLVLDDIEYVKYSDTNITASNTVQKPFRSAILKGNTLVNLSLFKDTALNVKGVREKKCYNKDMIKPNTNYLISYNVVAVSGETVMKIDGMNVNSFPTELGKHKMIVRTISNLTTTFPNNLWITGNSNSIEIDDFLIIEYQDGMENWDIPYFEGMQSVKMPVLTTTGKNLISNDVYPTLEEIPYNHGGIQTALKLQLSPNTSYKFSMIKTRERVDEFDGYNYIVNSDNVGKMTYRASTPVGTQSVIRITTNTDGVILIAKYGFNFWEWGDCIVSLDDGTNDFVDYEPFKSNILTVNEDVTLRSNGSVYDELDLLTGKLTQRIDEDGSVLTQEVVKTVDLKVVDQDGNPVKQLSAFDETTHIVSSSASDNSLIAIAEVEVPTKLIEALNDVKSLSSDVEILINEVDNAQKLQDENSTMVMSAMTELYEMVLMMGGGS